MNNRPPPFGSLRSVVPVQQSQKRGPWRLTLICLEIWDNCWAANFDIDRDPRGPEDEFFYPYLTLEAISEGSQRYVSGFGGSYGGGRFDSGQHHRQLVPFVPIIDLISESVRLEARLQLSHPGNRSTLHDPPDWEDPEPWVFEIPRIGANGLPSAKPLTPSHEAPSIPRPPYDLGAPLWVVPVEAEQTIGDWTVTIVSADVRTHGLLLVYRLLGPNQRTHRGGMASLHLRFSDEHGHEIPSLAGGNTGIGDPRGVYIRGDYHAAVPSGTNDLCIRVDEIQIETIEVYPDHPGMARPVVAERTPFGWDLTVPLQ